jgi:hypothetical protein
MIKHIALEDACHELGLYWRKSGSNILAEAIPIGCFAEVYDLRKIYFPKSELNEVERIGIVINNLYSQMKFPAIYDGTTKTGRETIERDRKIEKLLPIIIETQKYWFEKGLQKAKPKGKEFIICYGRIFQINPQHYKDMEAINKRLAEDRRIYRKKSVKSNVKKKFKN